MAEDIQNTFGLDASAALATLASLDSAFLSFEQRVKSLGSTLKDFNQNSSATTAAIKQIGPAFASSAGQATAATQQLTISFGLLSRIVTTQLIVRALSQVRNAMSEALTSAIEFKSRVQEAVNISGGTIGNANQVASEIRKISDAFNVPLNSVTAGLYQTLSFNIGQGAESLRFLGQAALFAKGAFLDTEDAVKLGAQTLNAYSLSAAHADEIFSKLERTINLGAVRGTDLAANLSKVTPVANELGVSLDEVFAAFATLTKRGVSPAIAATQIRASMLALIKPSTDMEAALQKLGFTTAKTAVETLGYGGLLKSLRGTTDGTAESLAKLDPNLRALLGALVLGGHAADDYATVLEKVRTTSNSLSSERGLSILETDAQHVASAMNKVTNALTVDLGTELIGVLDNFAGSTDRAIAFVKALGPVLEVGAAAAAVYASAMLLGATANTTFIATFAGVPGLIYAAIAVAAGKSIGNFLSQQVTKGQEEFDAALKSYIESLKKTADEANRVLADADTKHIQGALNNVASLNAVYLKDLDNARAANKSLVKDTESTLSHIISVRGKYAEELSRQSEKAREIAQSAGNRVEGLQQKQADRDFSRAIQDQSGPDQAAQRLFRAIREADEASTQLKEAGKSGDQNAIARAEELFTHASQEAQTAESIAKQTKDKNLQAQVAGTLRRLTQTQVEAEQQLQAAQQRRVAALEKEHAVQDAIVSKIREQADIIVKNSDLFEKGTNQPLSQDKQAEQAKKRQDALKELVKLGFSQKDLDIGKALGLTKFLTENIHDLQAKPIQLQFSVNNGITKITNSIQQAFDHLKLNLNFNEPDLEHILGKKLTTPDEIAQGIVEATQKVQKLREGFSQIGVDDTNIKGLRLEIDGIVKSMTTLSASKVAENVGLDPGRVKLLSEARQDIERMSKSSNILQGDLELAFGKLQALQQSNSANGFKRLVPHAGLDLQLQELAPALLLLKQIQQLQEGRKTNPATQPGALKQLESLNKFIGGLDPSSKFESASTAISKSVATSQDIANSWQTAAAAAERLRSAASGIGAPSSSSSSGNPKSYSTGGIVPLQYFDSGGAAKGIDTMPAMLAPHEVVMNQDASSRFFSQLQAMNAGINPQVQRTQSGDTYQIGDININGAGNPKDTAREVINQIRREQRRGSGNRLS